MSRISLIACTIMLTAGGTLAPFEPLSAQIVAPPAPTHVIRLHGVRTANDNGSNISQVTAVTLASALPTLNDIFQGTGITFVFDPVTDFETRHSTLINQRYEVLVNPTAYTNPNQMPPHNSAPYTAARRALADEHRDKLTIVFANPQILSFNETLGFWTMVGATGASSGGFGRWVSWNDDSVNASTLAHEIGHYLHNAHTHVGNINTVQQASDYILGQLNAGNFTPPNGLYALDGDWAYVLDTPPDARPPIFNDAYGSGATCGPEDTVNIPVTFNYAPNNYALTPDRTNIMSYFNCFVSEKHFSPNQTTRLRNALELMNRRSISSHQPSASPDFINLSNQTAGTISNLAMTRVSYRRVVTATTGGSVLKLIVWDVSATGSITRKGEITVGAHAGRFAVTHAGMSQVAIAYRTNNGLLAVKSYAINPAGDLTHKDTEIGEAITDVAVTQYSAIKLATPVRLSNGLLRVVAWEVWANGEITRLAHGDGPLVTAVATAAFTPDNDESDEYVSGAVAVHARNNSGGLAVYTFEIVSAGATEVQLVNSSFAGSINDVAATAVDFDVSASVAITSTNQQKVILWETDYFGAITRKADYGLSDCTWPAVTGIGTRLLATACRVPSTGDIIMSLFEVGTEGATLTLRDQLSAGTGSAVALAQVGHDMMMVARMVYPGNYLMMQSYRIQD